MNIRKKIEKFNVTTDVIFVSTLTKQRLLKVLEATVKVFLENRQQRIAGLPKFNDTL
jgi:GTP-binding protein